MLKALRDLLGPSRSEDAPHLAGYEAIGDDLEPRGGDQPDSRRRDANERGVYWAFWILGAGVLLAWNGEVKLLVSAHDSAHLHDAAAILLLPGRVSASVEPC